MKFTQEDIDRVTEKKREVLKNMVTAYSSIMDLYDDFYMIDTMLPKCSIEMYNYIEELRKELAGA